MGGLGLPQCSRWQYHGDLEPPFPRIWKWWWLLGSVGFNWACQKTPLVESGVCLQLWTYGRKILSSHPDCDGWSEWLVCGIFVPESSKTCSDCSRWWLSSPPDCQSRWLCADRLEVSWKRCKQSKRTMRKPANEAAPKISNGRSNRICQTEHCDIQWICGRLFARPCILRRRMFYHSGTTSEKRLGGDKMVLTLQIDRFSRMDDKNS